MFITCNTCTYMSLNLNHFYICMKIAVSICFNFEIFVCQSEKN